MGRGRAKPSSRQLNRLLHMYSKQLQQQPGNLRARLKLAEVCRLLGRDDEAVRLYRGTAVCHAVAGDLPKAIVICQLILAIRPYHDETQRMLARIYGSKRVRDAKHSVPVRKATSSLFRVISPDERAQVVQSFVRERFEAGQPVVLEGSPGNTFYVLLVGQVEVTQLSDQGEDVLLGVLSEGDYFGEMSLVSGEASGATVRTTRVTEVLRLSSSSFYALAAAYPQVWTEVQREADLRDAINEQALGERKARALLL